QHPAARDGVCIRRHRVVEDGQAGVAVPLPDVAEYLVVGPVLADYVHDMADGRTGGRAVRYGPQARVGVGTERVDLTRVAREGGRVGDGNERDRSRDDVADVFMVGVRP